MVSRGVTANVESLNSRIRDGCLNINSFWSPEQARVVISDWKHDYSHYRATLRWDTRLPLATPRVLTDDRGRGVTRLANCVGETASTPRLGPATGGSSGRECGRATADDSWPMRTTRLLFVVYGRDATRINGNHEWSTGNVIDWWTNKYGIYWQPPRTTER
jgi:hypothetical protein